MDRLLITGASGFIGGKLTDYYSKKSLRVRLLVRDPAKLPEFLQQKAEVCIGDLTMPDTLKSALQDVDAVISAAGLLGAWKLSYQQLFETNVQGVENLIIASFDAGVKRFVHLSAGGVTGPVGKDPVDESYSPAPRTDYERTKWEGERRALELAQEQDMNLLVVRPTFTYGPGDPHKLNLFVTVKKGHFAFIGNGLSTVHPVYIDDLIRGVDKALESDRKGRSYILGGPRPVTKREMVYGIADVLGIRRPTVKFPVPLANTLAVCCEAAARLFGFEPPLTRSRVLALSCNWGYSFRQAQDELGYHPEIDLTEGLRRTVHWYLENGWL